MIPYNKHILKISPFLMGLIALCTMVSCGSYEYSGYDRDGIYNSNNTTYTNEPDEVQPQNNQVVEKDDVGYYENYFGQEAKEIEQARNMIFTDVDSYSSNEPDSTYNEDEMYLNEGIAYNSGNATWGSNPTEVNINYYDTGYGYPYYGGWSSFAWGYGYAGNSFYFGWRNPYNAYYNPYYNPFYNPYTYNPYYGYGGYYGNYNNPYYYGYGYAPYYYNGYYNPYYARVVRHQDYRNGNRSSYDRPDARNRNRTSVSNNRSVRSQNDDGRTNRSSVDRIRNPRRINADSRRDDARRATTRTRTETRRSNSRSNERARRSTRSSRDDHARSSRSRSSNNNSVQRSTRSSSNSRSNVRRSTRSYSPPARSTSSRSSTRGSSRRGGR